MIFEFERNISYRREIFVTRYEGDGDGAGESVALEAETALPGKIYEILVIDECHSGPDEDGCAWLVDAQKFMVRHQRLKQARAKREAVEEIVRADHYIRRAGNQLVKALKELLKGL